MNGRAHASLIIRVIVVLAAMLAGPAARGQDAGPFPSGRRIVRGDGTTGPYSLDVRFIGGTVTIESTADSSNAVAESDPNQGTILFAKPLAVGDSVVVRFANTPSWLNESYSLDQQDTPFGVSIPHDYRSTADKTPKPFPGLTFGGSKTFDINVGSDRQTALNQSLRLSIAGHLTDDITLNAVISDQNVPITPEGDTRELNELDRVLIELRGKHFRVDMGDTDLENVSGRWLGWSRRLSGATAGVSYGGTEAFASGAVSEGRHMSTVIVPIEGNQGPYRLITEDGRNDISIVPGTEKVWINGEQLTRGINDGYIIDYSTGELTFAESRIIGADMRIVCDYEYTSESYRRTFYSGGAKGSYLGGKMKLSVVAAREADDPNRPVLLDLDKTMKDTLKAAGDSSVTFTGIRPAESDTSGVYDLIDGILVYNPARKGEYNATFSWVGTDVGSYKYKGGGIYEFVPEDQRTAGSGASYDPVIVLPGPVSHSIGGATVSLDPTDYLHVGGEAAVSAVDANSMSSADDDNNNGGAWGVDAAFSPSLSDALPVKLMVTGNHRSRGERFRTLDRDRTAEENRRWGFPIVMDPAKELVTEYSGGLVVDDGRFSGSEIGVNGGRFELGESSLSKREGVRGGLRIKDRGTSDLSVDRIVREDVPGLPDETIDRIEGKAGFGVSGFTPTVAYEGEKRLGRNESRYGVSYDEVRTGLSFPGAFGMNGTLEWMYRSERMKQHEAWADSATIRGGSFEIMSNEWKSGSVRARYARRERIEDASKSASDQGLLETAYRPESGAVSFDMSYRAGRSRETVKQKNYIYTGGDRGSYRWEDMNGDGVRDPEEFIPDEHGSYYLYEETLDDYRPVNSVAAFGKLGLELPPFLIERLTGTAFDVTSETSFEVNERSSAPASDVFLLKLSRFRKRGLTTSGNARLQQDVTLPVAGDGSLRLRAYRLASYEAEYVSGAERRREDEESARLRLPMAEGWDVEMTVRHGIAERTMETRSSGDFRVHSWSGDAETSYYPRSTVKAGVSVGGGYDNDRLSGIRARYYILKPSAAYYFSGKGRVEASYAMTSVAASGLGTRTMLPYTMARGRMEGSNHDISVSCDYRLSHRMNIVATYSGRRFAGRDFENFASTQLRAMF